MRLIACSNTDGANRASHSLIPTDEFAECDDEFVSLRGCELGAWSKATRQSHGCDVESLGTHIFRCKNPAPFLTIRKRPTGVRRFGSIFKTKTFHVRINKFTDATLEIPPEICGSTALLEKLNRGYLRATRLPVLTVPEVY